MLCDEKAFVYIRTPRTGTNSLVAALRPHVRLHAAVPGIPHPTIAHYQHLQPSLPYISFGFVRNPWAWYVSFWSIMKQDGQTFNDFMLGRPSQASWHCNSPMKWLTSWNEGDSILVDHVFKYEQYNESMDKIREITQVDFTVNESSPGYYGDDYTVHYNEHSTLVVTARCRDCIDHFGYKFGDES